MGILEIVLVAIGLAMDAFAVAICKGLAIGKLKIRHYITIGVWFGGFQALMPLLGYLLGSTFSDYAQKFDNWVAFILLAIIGANMIREAFGDEEEECETSLTFLSMFMLAVATSIDAMAVGVTFAFYEINIILAVLLIGGITFTISVLGVKIGNLFGTRYKKKSEIAGGCILIILALKFLIEGLTSVF